MIGSVEYGEDKKTCTFTLVSPEYVKELIDENKQLKETIEDLEQKGSTEYGIAIMYKERIDKAIEYIKKNSYGWETKYFQDEALASELLEILGDKE